MNSPKKENILNLAMDVTPEERMRSNDLNTGFNIEQRTWEVIVKYQGNLDFLREQGIIVEELIAGYAILTIPENQVDAVADLVQIEYMEKPKNLYFALLEELGASCVLPVTIRAPYLSGEGVLIAVIDTGIDYQNRVFRNEDGTTRIEALWDQTIAPDPERGWEPPEGFSEGTVFTREQINEAIAAGSAGYRILPSTDISGHGTSVTSIAAGYLSLSAAGLDSIPSGNAGSIPEMGSNAGRNAVNTILNEEIYGTAAFLGTAPKSTLLIVKLGNPQPGSFPRTTQLMRAVTWCLREAARLEMPLCINLSFGNSYGAHDGTSLIERFLDNAAEIGRTSICVGSGNEGSSAGHTMDKLQNNQTRTEVLTIGEYEPSLSIQLWLDAIDAFEITLRSPGGKSFTFQSQSNQGNTINVTLEQTKILIYIGAASPYSAKQEIYFDMLPADSAMYLNSGDWSIELRGENVRLGSFHLYLPSAQARGSDTFFLRPATERTLTIPSTASKVITVGAYRIGTDNIADFSGRGYYYVNSANEFSDYGYVKPDLVAPGVNIRTIGPGNSFITVSGTSFATPFVTGGAALLMEWGIIRGNDPYLYGEKLKSYLIRGARKLPSSTVRPDQQNGDCVKLVLG